MYNVQRYIISLEFIVKTQKMLLWIRELAPWGAKRAFVFIQSMVR